MPKNSRRKKQTRQHAVGKGERYMRARRSTGVTSQPSGGEHSVPVEPADYPPMAARCASTGEERVLPVQRLLESRGWVPLPYSGRFFDLTEEVATSIADLWEFAAGFGGVELEDDEDFAPQKPTLGFNGGIWIDTAGNWGGCEQHRSTKLELSGTQCAIAQLAELLGKIEDMSRTLDPGPYIECLEHGPCAELAEQRRGAKERPDT